MLAVDGAEFKHNQDYVKLLPGLHREGMKMATLFYDMVWCKVQTPTGMFDGHTFEDEVTHWRFELYDTKEWSECCEEFLDHAVYELYASTVRSYSGEWDEVAAKHFIYDRLDLAKSYEFDNCASQYAWDLVKVLFKTKHDPSHEGSIKFEYIQMIISNIADLDKLLDKMNFRYYGINPENIIGRNIIDNILGSIGRDKRDETEGFLYRFIIHLVDETKLVLTRKSQEEKEDGCLNVIAENMHWMFNLSEDQVDELLERKDIKKLCLLSEELRDNLFPDDIPIDETVYEMIAEYFTGYFSDNSYKRIEKFLTIGNGHLMEPFIQYMLNKSRDNVGYILHWALKYELTHLLPNRDILDDFCKCPIMRSKIRIKNETMGFLAEIAHEKGYRVVPKRLTEFDCKPSNQDQIVRDLNIAKASGQDHVRVYLFTQFKDILTKTDRKKLRRDLKPLKKK